MADLSMIGTGENPRNGVIKGTPAWSNTIACTNCVDFKCKKSADQISCFTSINQFRNPNTLVCGPCTKNCRECATEKSCKHCINNYY